MPFGFVGHFEVESYDQWWAMFSAHHGTAEQEKAAGIAATRVIRTGDKGVTIYHEFATKDGLDKLLALFAMPEFIKASADIGADVRAMTSWSGEISYAIDA